MGSRRTRSRACIVFDHFMSSRIPVSTVNTSPLHKCRLWSNSAAVSGVKLERLRNEAKAMRNKHLYSLSSGVEDNKLHRSLSRGIVTGSFFWGWCSEDRSSARRDSDRSNDSAAIQVRPNSLCSSLTPEM